MLTLNPSFAIKLEYVNQVSTSPLSRYLSHRQRLHEPTICAATTAPMTGNVFINIAGNPCLKDGNLMKFSGTEQSQKRISICPPITQTVTGITRLQMKMTEVDKLAAMQSRSSVPPPRQTGVG